MEAYPLQVRKRSERPSKKEIRERVMHKLEILGLDPKVVGLVYVSALSPDAGETTLLGCGCERRTRTSRTRSHSTSSTPATSRGRSPRPSRAGSSRSMTKSTTVVSARRTDDAPLPGSGGPAGRGSGRRMFRKNGTWLGFGRVLTLASTLLATSACAPPQGYRCG